MNDDDPHFEQDLTRYLERLADNISDRPDAARVLARLRRRTLFRASSGAAGACIVLIALAAGLQHLLIPGAAPQVNPGVVADVPQPIRLVLVRSMPDLPPMPPIPTMSLVLPPGPDISRIAGEKTNCPTLSMPAVPSQPPLVSMKLTVPSMSLATLN